MQKIVILDNKSCQFVTDNADLLRVLRSTFSYKTIGVEFTEAYKNGWNGVTYLVSKKGCFYFGLLNKVKEFLTERHETFEIKDLRQSIEISPSIDLTEKLKAINITPRDYQDRIVNVCYNSQNGIVRACTASGKSLVIALITAKLNKPTIVYVIGLDLLKQFHDLFTKLFDEEIGYIGDGICNIKRINIASIWTIGRALNINKKDICSDEEIVSEEEYNESQTDKILNMLDEVKVHFLDECHTVTTSTMTSIYKKIDPQHIYGFSGTPYRGDGSELLSNAILGEQIIDVQASELIEKGVLAKPIIKFISVPSMSMTTAPYQTVYKAYVTDNVVRNNIIVNQVKELVDKNYTPLILFKQIKHGQILFEMIKDAGIKCEMLYGNDSMKRRTEVKEMLNNKEINVILSSTIFDIGVDLPILNALVLCGGGKSYIRALQRIGRVIRPYSGKKYVAVVDFYDQVKFLKKHSMIRYDIYCSEQGFKVIKSKEMK